MSSEFDFEINSSDSETDDFDFEDNKKELEICVLLNVHGTVKAIVDTIDCLQKNNTKCILYILDNGSHEIYRKYIEDNILKQNYGCVSVKYHFEKTPINVDEMFQKGMDLIVNDNVEKIIFSHNYEFSNNAKEIINQHPILFQNTFRINVLFKIENTRSETKNVKSLPLDKKPLNKPLKKNFVKRLKERKINRNVDSQTFYENKNKFRHMIKKQGKKENKKKENKIGVIACTNKCKFLFNIVNNYCQQTYSNKKLFVVLNNESIDKNILVHLLNKRNANYEILHVDSKYKLGHCLNQAISKCHEQGIKYCSKFDDDDIYLPEYLTEQVNALDTQGVILVGKSVCMLYKPYTNECRLIDHGICDSVENSYTNFVWGATLTFDIQRLKKFGVSFNESVHSGSDSIFNRDVSKYGKTYATTRNNYYCLRYDDGSHTWGDIGLNLKDYKQCEAPDFCLETTEYLNELNRRNIFQCYASNDLKHLEDRMITKYNVTNKNIDTNKPVVVFGLYYDQDYEFLKNHVGDKYVIFGGSDIDMAKYQSKIREIQKYNKIHFLSISKNIQTRLYKKSIYSDLIKLDLVNRTIFKPPVKKGDYIFVYDGRLWQRNDDTYGKSIFTKVMKRLPQYKFIFSSQLNVDNIKMVDIYAKCFIGLRLTPRDGNANMVQEMEAMGIPVVHNHSDYGLKWKTVDDVVNLVRKEKPKKILLNSHINLNNIAGDSIWQSNLINKFHCDNNYINIVTKYKLVNRRFEENIEKEMYEINCVNNIVQYIDENHDKYDEIIIRNHEILDYIRNKTWLNKTIFYGLDVHIEGISHLKYKKIWTQSELLKEKYIEKGIPEDKIEITPPIGYKYNFYLPEKNDSEIRLIYCGTLRDEENILEIIEEFQKIHVENPKVKLKIVYGKINGNKDFNDKVNAYIKHGVKGLTFKHNLSHRDACYEIATSDIGICWRKNGWGDNGEVSTKVKEYEM